MFPSGSAIHFLATPAEWAAPLSGELFKQRLEKWGLRPKWLTADELVELTQPFHVEQVRKVLNDTPVHALNTDLHPVAYSHALRLWAETFKKRGRGMFVNDGAHVQLLKDERSRFLEKEWPVITATIQRLGLDAAELLKQQSEKDAGGDNE